MIELIERERSLKYDEDERWLIEMVD